MPMPFELASGAVGAVERKLRRLVRCRIVGSVRLPTSSADAADAGALGAGEYVYVSGAGAVEFHDEIIIVYRRVHHYPNGGLPAQTEGAGASSPETQWAKGAALASDLSVSRGCFGSQSPPGLVQW